LSDKILVFTDGACSGNPGPGGWAAVLVSPTGKVIELGGGERHTTNNKMELTAAVEALKALAKVKTLSTRRISLYTDSKYVIQGITSWIHGWKKRSWKNQEGKDVSNREIWEQLDDMNRQFEVNWLYVPGHQGFPGNERCDEIAVAFAKGYSIQLYNGPRSGYGLAIENVPMPSRLEDEKAAAPKRTKMQPVYLSYVDGKLNRDADWKSCEARVKGRHGVKFKKVESVEEEQEILRSWGLK
jgi:ribonuclease HI